MISVLLQNHHLKRKSSTKFMRFEELTNENKEICSFSLTDKRIQRVIDLYMSKKIKGKDCVLINLW